MVARIPECDFRRLERVLSGRAGVELERELERHLAICDACCQELESRAGGAAWSSEVKHYLGELGLGEAEQLDWSQHSHSGPPCGPAGARTAGATAELRFLAKSTDPRALGRLGSYEVLEVIGRGGMGLVLKAFDPALARQVAIKVLVAPLAGHAAARRRFAREAQAAAAVVHDHVMAIHAVDVEGELPYLVMPLLIGKSLEQRLAEEGPLSVREVARIGMQTAAGLAAAHRQGLVHRDIKPANILLENGLERVKITDFGLARAVDDASLTQTGTVAGTPQYMSPEQARGEALDHRSDLYSLGSVLYAMATGRPPFRAASTLGMLRKIAETSPRPAREVNPDVPAWLSRLIEMLHRRDPEERIGSAEEVALLLEQCLAHLERPLALPVPAALRPKWFTGERLRKLRLGLVSAVVVAGVVMSAAVGGYLGWHWGEGVGPGSGDVLTQGDNTTVDAASAPVEPTSADSKPRLSWVEEFDSELSVAVDEVVSLEHELHPPPGAPTGAPDPLDLLNQRIDTIEQELGTESKSARE